ncbi:MIT domain-containing protein 1-like isoform X2 [Homarus americanus]|nr:MIT domain-containing protein 1-like isoform X2 [Homarus americanus]XP_042233446.1 MIT domain-containing protein 1-like isoform X2 [Homarus americanus]XP_042233454.1 MIT domain-containing protein 1-like isoform X2 [Homarus americanus]
MSGGGPEAAAVQVLTRAVQLDNEKKFAEALACYEQGIRLLLQAEKEVNDEGKRSHFRKKTKEYLSRAEAMKEAAAKQRTMGRTHKQIQVEAGATGYSYETIFGPLLDKTLSSVVVEDAYIRSTHQIYNFLHFCELLVLKAECLRSITLRTTRDPSGHGIQHERLSEIQQSLEKHSIKFTFIFSDTIHDREIRFDNGWIIKIGRGLDYFRKADGRFSLGWTEYHFRQCHQTTIDIFHQQSVE